MSERTLKTPAPQKDQRGADVDSDERRSAPIDTGGRRGGATHMQALMTAGGNQAMVQLSQSDGGAGARERDTTEAHSGDDEAASEPGGESKLKVASALPTFQFDGKTYKGVSGEISYSLKKHEFKKHPIITEQDYSWPLPHVPTGKVFVKAGAEAGGDGEAMISAKYNYDASDSSFNLEGKISGALKGAIEGHVGVGVSAGFKGIAHGSLGGFLTLSASIEASESVSLSKKIRKKEPVAKIAEPIVVAVKGEVKAKGSIRGRLSSAFGGALKEWTLAEDTIATMEGAKVSLKIVEKGHHYSVEPILTTMGQFHWQLDPFSDKRGELVIDGTEVEGPEGGITPELASRISESVSRRTETPGGTLKITRAPRPEAITSDTRLDTPEKAEVAADVMRRDHEGGTVSVAAHPEEQEKANEIDARNAIATRQFNRWWEKEKKPELLGRGALEGTLDLVREDYRNWWVHMKQDSPDAEERAERSAEAAVTEGRALSRETEQDAKPEPTI